MALGRTNCRWRGEARLHLVSIPTVLNSAQLEPTLPAWGRTPPAEQASVHPPRRAHTSQNTTLTHALYDQHFLFSQRRLRCPSFTNGTTVPPYQETTPLAPAHSSEQPHNRFRRAFQALSSRRSSHLPAFLTSLSPTHSPTSPVPTLYFSSAVFATRQASQQSWDTTTTHTAASSAA